MIRPKSALALLLCLLVASVSHAAQTTSHTLAADTPWETMWYLIDSGKAGPTVFITGGIHGNEPAGAAAAEQVMHWPIESGRLIVIPRSNVLALAAKSRYLPDEDDEVNNLNRVFPREVGGPCTHPLATAIWAVVQKHDPSWVIDLHEGYDYHQQNDDSVGATIIFKRGSDDEQLAAGMLADVNATIEDEKKQLVLRPSGVVRGSLVRAALDEGRHGMILETTYKDMRLPVRVRQHRTMVRHVLVHLGMISPDAALPMVPQATDRLRVALFDDGGVGGSGPGHLETILRQRNALVCRVDGHDVRHGALKQFDLVIMPGGSASKQADSLGSDGRANVTQFVDHGGGYMGICAGAYLATTGFSWSLKIIDAKTLHKDKQWQRGVGPVKIEITDTGSALTDTAAGELEVKYANGPILGPSDDEKLQDYQVLAWFRTELAKNGTPEGLMINTPAIISAPFGDGRVVAVSPHPEQNEATYAMVARMIEWAAERDAAHDP